MVEANIETTPRGAIDPAMGNLNQAALQPPLLGDGLNIQLFRADQSCFTYNGSSGASACPTEIGVPTSSRSPSSFGCCIRECCVKSTGWLFWIVLLGIVALAGAIRFHLASFEFTTQPDEDIITQLVNRHLQTGSWSTNWAGVRSATGPLWWSMPTYQFSPYTLTSYAVQRLFYLLGDGDKPNTNEIKLINRNFSAAVGTLTVLLAGVLARWIVRQRLIFPPANTNATPEEIARNADLAGWSAALLFAFCFLHVQDCIYTRVESMLSLLTILTLWLMLNLIRRSTFGSMSIAGLVTGITIACKYNQGFWMLLLFATIAFVQFQWWQLPCVKMRAWSSLLLVSIAAAIGFFAATPELLLDEKPFKEGLIREYEHYKNGHMPHEAFDQYDWNAKYFLEYLTGLGMGWGAVGLVGFFLVNRAIYGNAIERMLAISIVVGFTLVSLPKVRFERNLEVILGPMLVAGGVGFADLLSWLERRFLRFKLPLLVALAVALLAIIQPAITLSRFRSLLEFGSLKMKVPSGQTTILFSYYPPGPYNNSLPYIVMLDFGDPFSVDRRESWNKLLQKYPHDEMVSPWEQYGYPFSSVNIYHGPLRLRTYNLMAQ